MMSLAKALSPGRAFAVYAGAQVGLAAVTTALIPRFIDSQGARAPFLVLTLASALGFALCPLLPRRSALPPPAVGPRDSASFPKAAILAIVALFVFFAGQGALEPVDPSVRIDPIPAAGITQALTLLNFAGLAGALGVGATAHRVNPRIALPTLLATEILAIAGLFTVHSSAGFIVSAGVFYFSWCASFPFQFTVISQSDSSGRASAVVPAADGLGLAGARPSPARSCRRSDKKCARLRLCAAGGVGIMLYIGSATLSKRPSRWAQRPGAANAAADAAALER